jgi:uncharacterized iron-regulated protein
MRILLMAALCCLSAVSEAQIQTRPIPKPMAAGVPAKNIQAFQIFDAQGKKVSYEQFLKAITVKLQKSAPQPSVVLFGELHDNPIVHWLQYQTTSDLFRVTPYMVLGAEMFETDQQAALNEYLNPTDTSAKTSTVVTPMGAVMGGDPTYDKFKKSTKLWPNFYTDYKPLVDFAKEHQMPFIATNIPRKYASLVYRGGFAALDTLPAEKKALFPTMPIAYDSSLGCYAEIFKATGGHGGQNLPKSQAVKDATMAWKIYHNLPSAHYGEQVMEVSNSKTSPRVNPMVFIHYNGSYHSDNHESIEWYLRQEEKSAAAVQMRSTMMPPMTIITISARMQDDVTQLETDNKGAGDFIIVTPNNMNKTH